MTGPAQPPQYQAVYRACIKEAAAQGAALMQATLARALNELPQHAPAISDPVERSHLMEAVAVARVQQHALAEAFPPALLAEVAQAIADDRGPGPGFDVLTLLGDEQLQDQADLVRAAQRLHEAVEPQLLEFEALLRSTQGVVANPQRHPLRPEVYVRALQRVARQSPVAPHVRRRWLRYLPAVMGPELARTYELLAGMLRVEGVQDPVDAPPARAMAPPDRATQLTIRELRQLLTSPAPSAVDAGDSTHPGTDDPATEFPHTVPAAFHVLQDMRKVDQLLLQLRQRQVAMPDSVADSREAFRQAVQQQVRSPAQLLGLEVVHLMLEHLAGDARLLPPVQEAMRDLEPALLRMALADPRFFSDREHPARQLLEQVTQRSLAWSSVGAPGFAEFIEGLEQAVEVLLETRATGGAPFEIALGALREAWADSHPPGRRREKAVRALLRAEQRNLLAGRIALQLRERPDAAVAPPEVMAFLTGPWAQVLAQARLADDSGEDDAAGYAAMVPLLLGSVQPALVARATPHQAQLVARIDAGLGSIEHSAADTQRWQAVLRQLRTVAHFTAMGAAPHVSEPMPLPTPAETWLAPPEAHDSGYLAEEPPADDAQGPDNLPPIDLHAGAWVEFLGDGWERWQLTWSSPHGMLFLFTHGAATRSMTRRRLRQMMAEGRLRLVSGRGVLDGALDAVAQAAWRNSVHGEELP